MSVIEGTRDRIADGGLAGSSSETTAIFAEPGGLAGWVLGILRRRSERTADRHLQVIETLALGGRRQLMLVTCDGERFLVGSGADRVDTIVRVGAARTAEDTWV